MKNGGDRTFRNLWHSSQDGPELEEEARNQRNQRGGDVLNPSMIDDGNGGWIIIPGSP